MKFVALLKLAVFSFFLICCGSKNSEVSAQNSHASSNSTTPAKVTLSEYSDYQCPACGYFHPIVEKLKDEFGNQLKVEYNYFPLNSHQYAALAARAAQAAENQGQFKPMHDMLFENQNHWSSSGDPQPIFVSYAKEIGLDVDQFEDDLNSTETQRAVMEEKRQGEEIGVNSTPTFFINGAKVEQNPANYEAFKTLVESYMKEAN